MPILRRLFGRSNWREGITPEARWARAAADQQAVVDAIFSSSPEAEFDGLVAVGHQLEADYQRRSRHGQRDIDPGDRLRGVTYVFGVQDARRLQDMTDGELEMELVAHSQEVRDTGVNAMEGHVTKVYMALAELRRRRGGPRLLIADRWSEAVRVVELPDLTRVLSAGGQSSAGSGPAPVAPGPPPESTGTPSPRTAASRADDLPPYLGMGLLSRESITDTKDTFEATYAWQGRDLYRVVADKDSGGGERWSITDLSAIAGGTGPDFATAAGNFAMSVVSGASSPGGLADELRHRSPRANVIFPPPGGEGMAFVPALAICSVVALNDPALPPLRISDGPLTGVPINVNPFGDRPFARVVFERTGVAVATGLSEYHAPAIDVAHVVEQLELASASAFPVLILGMAVPEFTVRFEAPVGAGPGSLWRLSSGPIVGRRGP